MHQIKRLVVAVVGGTVLALGIALIVLPGPAFLVIPAGLAILAIEVAWARRWLRSARALRGRAVDSSTIQSLVRLRDIASHPVELLCVTLCKARKRRRRR